VLLEAGLPCCHHSWLRVLPLLRAAEPQLLVCAYDRAGYCHSDLARGAARADAAIAAQAVGQLLSAVVGGREVLAARGVLLVGWSYGAYVAALAAARPEALRGLVRGLVLVDPTPPNVSSSLADFEQLRRSGEVAFRVLERVRPAGVCLAAGRAGLLPQHAGWPPVSGLPEEMAARMRAALCWRGWAEAAGDELAAWAVSEAAVERVLADGPLEPRPDMWVERSHERWCGLSRQARVLPVASDHDIPYHAPERVAAAVLELWRQQAPAAAR
jgi:pimeloyl-ACP methyl ester carboxylesterase